MKKIDPIATPGSNPRYFRLTTMAIRAIGMNVYFVSRPAPNAAARVASSSASTNASETPRSGQSTSDQPAVSASAGVATIAAVRIGQSRVRRSRSAVTAIAAKRCRKCEAMPPPALPRIESEGRSADSMPSGK